MERLFGTPEWRNLRDIEDPQERCEAAIQLFQRGLGARYVTWIKMLGENRAIKYVLIHATHHPKGRELMKEAIWSVAPEGEFAARVADNPQQEFLIQPEPDLTPLADWLRHKYLGYAVKYQEIENELIATIYRPKHLHDVIRMLRDNGEIECKEYSGRFSFKQNPTIDFRPKPPKPLKKAKQ